MSYGGWFLTSLGLLCGKGFLGAIHCHCHYQMQQLWSLCVDSMLQSKKHDEIHNLI
jgi:hypothetical protein